MRFFKKAYIVPLVFGFVCGIIVSFAVTSATQNPTALRGSVLRQDLSNYPLIAPILACDVGSEQAFPEFGPLKSQLNTLIANKENGGAANDISIYLRSLRTGRWFEIGDSETYAPASLLKVFVMMAYYKEADATDNPGLLQKRVPFETSTAGTGETPGEVIPHLAPGSYYSIEQLIEQMIIYSDNDALNTLVDNFDPTTLSYFEKIFNDLSIPSPITQKESDLNFISVSNYAMVFRVLYGSTYLSERYSQKALEILSQAHYKGALVAGVPGNLLVAHKFGVGTVGTGATAENELHDCGIVYYPNHPYLLCVMTRGTNFADLQKAIADISKSSYTWLDHYFNSLPASSTSTQ